MFTTASGAGDDRGGWTSGGMEEVAVAVVEVIEVVAVVEEGGLIEESGGIDGSG